MRDLPYQSEKLATSIHSSCAIAGALVKKPRTRLRGEWGAWKRQRKYRFRERRRRMSPASRGTEPCRLDGTLPVIVPASPQVVRTGHRRFLLRQGVLTRLPSQFGSGLLDLLITSLQELRVFSSGAELAIETQEAIITLCARFRFSC